MPQTYHENQKRTNTLMKYYEWSRIIVAFNLSLR
jgi:hypothetical protein